MKKKLKIIIGLFLVIVIVFLIVLKYNLLIHEDVVVTDNSVIENSTELDGEEKKELVEVDIKGEVNNPGVYEVDNEKRVIDIITMAGGLKVSADTSLINLSKKVTDEMVIIIYSKEEVANSNVVRTVIKEVEGKCVCPNIQNDGCINTGVNDKISSSDDSGLVNINTASIEELQNLEGIGESKAKKIISYRDENGSFKSIEDIMNVSGIGQSMFDKIKNNICV